VGVEGASARADRLYTFLHPVEIFVSRHTVDQAVLQILALHYSSIILLEEFN
jgi:hypothetical protein